MGMRGGVEEMASPIGKHLRNPELQVFGIV
jgi:hypothetical protein